MNYGISYIVAHYNMHYCIEETVQSIIAAHADLPDLPYEIIVADDASPNPSAILFLSELDAIYPQVKVIYNKVNGNVAANRNSALAVAQYDYCMTLDGDDLLDTNPAFVGHNSYPYRSVQMLQTREDVAFCYPKFSEFEGNTLSMVFRPAHSEERLLYFHGIGPFVVYRLNEALEMGGYDPLVRHGADWAFNIALLNQRYVKGQPRNVHRFDEPYIKYRIRADGSNMTANPCASFEAEVTQMLRKTPGIFRKYYGAQSEDEIVEQLGRLHRRRFLMLTKEFFSEYGLHPVRAYHDAALGNASSQLTKLWRHVLKKIPDHHVVSDAVKQFGLHL